MAAYGFGAAGAAAAAGDDVDVDDGGAAAAEGVAVVGEAQLRKEGREHPIVGGRMTQHNCIAPVNWCSFPICAGVHPLREMPHPDLLLLPEGQDRRTRHHLQQDQHLQAQGRN